MVTADVGHAPTLQAVDLGDASGHLRGRFIVGLGLECQSLARGRPTATPAESLNFTIPA
jgi:hypothetical protein